MDVFNWMKMGSFEWASQFCGEKSHTSQDLVSTEHVQAVVFVFQLNYRRSSVRFFAIMFKFVVKTCLTVSLSIFNSSATNLMPKWWLALTRTSPSQHSHQCSLLLDRSFVIFHILPSFWTPLAGFKHKTLDRVSSPYASHNKLNLLLVVFFNSISNLMSAYSSFFYQAWFQQVKHPFIRSILHSTTLG